MVKISRRDPLNMLSIDMEFNDDATLCLCSHEIKTLFIRINRAIELYKALTEFFVKEGVDVWKITV